jgi:cystathionine beta-lyase/cystathionine gamma-synthase
VVFGSGMGAITATLWSMLEPGDEVLADITLYGCTFAFMNHGLTRFGVTVRHVDMTDPAARGTGHGPQDTRGLLRDARQPQHAAGGH